MFKPALAALLVVSATASAQVGPAVRQLGPVVATSTEQFGGLLALRHTSRGLLVNDGQNRRVVMLDSTLGNLTVIADSLGANGNAYGRTASLIAYRADSSLFIEPQSMSMLVLDAAGKVGRVMALPRTRDAGVIGSVIGAPSYDGKGRLVYRGMPQIQMRGMGGPGAAPSPPEIPDTMPILRVDLETRLTDTVAYVKMPRPKMDVTRDESTGRMSVNMTVNPLPTVDEFAVTADGSIALIRGRDYHVDWVRPDGAKESSAKMPFDWRRLTDEDKVTFMDSLKAARERNLAAMPAQAGQGPQASSSVTTTPDGGQRREMIMIGPGPGGGAGAAAAPGPMGMNMRNASFVPASELPDYQPPFFSGTARADMDGNVWIQTIPTKAFTGGPVYDVVNGKGELIDRVQVPKDRSIVGFGTGGIVYLAAREGGKTTLERARWR